jgi:hypothetical protein
VITERVQMYLPEAHVGAVVDQEPPDCDVDDVEE